MFKVIFDTTQSIVISVCSTWCLICLVNRVNKHLTYINFFPAGKNTKAKTSTHCMRKKDTLKLYFISQA